MLEQSTEQTNYCCAFTVVPNAFIGLECSEYTCYDLIIAKKDMQHLAAIDMLKVLRAVGSTTPVVLLLDEVDTTHDLAAESSGFFSVLRKPLSTRVLCCLIETIVNRENESSLSPATASSHPRNQNSTGYSRSDFPNSAQSQSSNQILKSSSPSSQGLSNTKTMGGVVEKTGAPKGCALKATIQASKLNSEYNSGGLALRGSSSIQNESGIYDSNGIDLETNEDYYDEGDAITTAARGGFSNSKILSNSGDTNLSHSPHNDSNSNISVSNSKPTPINSKQRVLDDNSDSAFDSFEAELLEIEGIKASRCARLESLTPGLNSHDLIQDNSLVNHSVNAGALTRSRVGSNSATSVAVESIGRSRNGENGHDFRQSQSRNLSSQYNTNDMYIREHLSQEQQQNSNSEPQRNIPSSRSPSVLIISEAEHSPLTEESYGKLNEKKDFYGEGNIRNILKGSESTEKCSNDSGTDSNSYPINSSYSNLAIPIASENSKLLGEQDEGLRLTSIEVMRSKSAESGMSLPGSACGISVSGSTTSDTKSVRLTGTSNSNSNRNSNSDNGVASVRESMRAFHPQVQGPTNSTNQNTNQYSQNQDITIPKVDGVWNREKAAKNLVREWAAEKGLSSIYPNLSSLSTALPFIENDEKDSIRFSTAIAAFITSQTNESRTQLLAEVASSLTRDRSAPSFNSYLTSKQLQPPFGTQTQSPCQTQSDSNGVTCQPKRDSNGVTSQSQRDSNGLLSPMSELVSGSGSTSGFNSTSTSTFSHSIPSPPTQTYLSTNGRPQRHVQTNSQVQSQSQSQLYNQVDNNINMEKQNNSGNSTSQSANLNITNVSAFTSLLSATGSSFNKGYAINRGNNRRVNSTGKVDGGSDTSKKVMKNQSETKNNSNSNGNRDTNGDDKDFQTSSVGRKRGFD